jgi:NAD(P)-dependent dehydrogenase (short-subunit alcohol dehydrogenase family)
MNNSRWIKLGLMTAGVATLGLAVAASRRRPLMSLARKVVLITGGARGLGLVLARKLGHAGARIVICSREADQLQTAREDLRQRKIEARAFECDVSDRAAVHSMIGQIEAACGPVDILVNNAGVIQMGPFDSLTRQDFETAMQTHFWGPLNVMQEVLPSMRARQHGSIVNIASIGGKVSIPHLIPYCSSKFALVGLSQGLAAELDKEGIHITTVCPGLMRTGSPRNALFKGRNKEEYAWFSILGSLPGLSLNAERAADQIVNAIQRKAKVSILGLPARVMTLLYDLFPNIMICGLGAANRVLPANGGIGRMSARGSESHSAISPSLLTQLTEKAALQNNEY